MGLGVLRPRIGKERPEFIDGAIGQSIEEHQGIALDHSQIRPTELLDVIEQASDARPVDIDRDQRIGGMIGHVGRREIAIAGSDFDTHFRNVGKQRAKVEAPTSFGESPVVQIRLETN